MTSIQGRGCPRRARTSEGPLGSLRPPESSHDEILANPRLLSLLLLNIQKKICKRSSERFSMLEPPLIAPVWSHWRPDYLTFIVVSPIWNVITSASSMRITLPPPGPKASIIFPLQYPSCMTTLTFVGSSTSGSMRLRAQSLSLERSSRSSFVKA